MKLAMLVLLFGAAAQVSAAGSAKTVTLNIHCWDGYVKPYVDDFKQLIRQRYQIEVALHITNVSNPDEFWQLARSGKVDLISPAHNIPKSIKWPFIKSGLAIPVDLANIPNYKNVLPFLQHNDFVTEAGKVYGVPYTMGPYGLAYNADKVTEPTSWSVLWSDAAQGKYTISKDYSDANIYVAALVLGAGYADLYDSAKLWPRVGRDRLQQKLSGLAIHAFSLWQGTANPDEFAQLDYAATWGYAVAVANRQGLHWKMARPKEGTTLWVDHWVMTAALKNSPLKKRLAEEWINFALGVQLQTGVIRNWGVSPVVTSLGDHITQAERDTFAVGDNAYWQSLSLWENQDIRTSNANAKFWHQAILQRKPQ